jgi:peptidylprolyl isomerase
MSPGDKFQFYIPHQLAYGEKRVGSIPPASLLIFEVELLAIES